jgi:hypothetical protein
MAEPRQPATTSTPATTPTDDMHWGISYLREDLQDLRHELRDLRNQMETRFSLVDGRMDAMHRRMDSRFGLLLTVTVAMNAATAGAIIAFLQIYLPR